MKKKLSIIFLTLALIFVCFVGVSPKLVMADTGTSSGITEGTGDSETETPAPDPDPDAPTEEQQARYKELTSGYELSNGSDISDSHLYSALLSIARDYIKDNCGMTYSGSSIYNTMFIYVENIDIPEKFDVQSLVGLEKIRLYALKNLRVAGHKLTDVKSNIFDYMPVLESLDLANNSITSVQLAALDKLSKINLSSNQLKQLDASMLPALNLEINLGNNKITEMKNIQLPTRFSTIKLNVMSNNITDLTDEYFSIPGMTINVGVQGIVNEDKVTNFTTSNHIKVYKFNMTGLSANIFKVETKPINKDILVKTIKDEDIEGNILDIDLAVGSYFVEYAINGTRVDTTKDNNLAYLKTYRFNVIPTECKFKFEYKGKTYETFDNKVTGKVKVYISCEDGGEIMYKVNWGEWQSGNEVMCDKGGNYSVTAKVIIDGVESEEKTVIVSTSLNVLIPDVLMLILVLLFTLTLFLIVVPIVSKKWFKN